MIQQQQQCRCVRLSSWTATCTFTTSTAYREKMLSRGISCLGAFSPRIKTAVFEGIEDAASELWRARRWMLGQSEGEEEQKQSATGFSKPCGDGFCVLLCVGRMSPEKRIPLLINALPPPSSRTEITTAWTTGYAIRCHPSTSCGGTYDSVMDSVLVGPRLHGVALRTTHFFKIESQEQDAGLAGRRKY